MPIRPEEYHPKWSLISYLIRVVRSGNRCECCGVPNETIIKRTRRSDEYRLATEEELKQYEALRAKGLLHWPALRRLKLTIVYTAVAHLDRNRNNNRFSNLQAQCQRCHLMLDMQQHNRSRRYGRYHDRGHQLTVFDNHA
jgi:hypothetical protein